MGQFEAFIRKEEIAKFDLSQVQLALFSDEKETNWPFFLAFLKEIKSETVRKTTLSEHNYKQLKNYIFSALLTNFEKNKDFKKASTLVYYFQFLKFEGQNTECCPISDEKILQNFDFWSFWFEKLIKELKTKKASLESFEFMQEVFVANLVSLQSIVKSNEFVERVLKSVIDCLEISNQQNFLKEILQKKNVNKGLVLFKEFDLEPKTGTGSFEDSKISNEEMR